MENNPNVKHLRIFIGESDKVGHTTLYETIVIEEKNNGFQEQPLQEASWV